LDANVWLALAAEAHAHHDRAQAFWSDEAAGVAAFCRVTQLAFLRHLTNPTIMGDHRLTPRGAWKKCSAFLALPEVRLLPEPPGLTEQLGRYCDLGRTSPNLWTDAYLAAFAKCAGLRLVSFDTGFATFTGLERLVLEPAPRKSK
jgi:toxin-antitoxin system PIN domain toxin